MKNTVVDAVKNVITSRAIEFLLSTRRKSSNTCDAEIPRIGNIFSNKTSNRKECPQFATIFQKVSQYDLCYHILKFMRSGMNCTYSIDEKLNPNYFFFLFVQYIKFILHFTIHC